MTFEYVSVEEAIKRDGLRMVVVGGVPSLWSEAAKGILHFKQLDWVAVRLVYDSDALKDWAGRSGPVLFRDQDAPRAGWADILRLAEQLAPTPALLPADSEKCALAWSLAHDICAEGGLGWSRRLQLVHASLQGAGGFPERVAKYLGAKYGYRHEDGQSHGTKVVALLTKFAARLHEQRAGGSDYLVGESPTAADIYCATAMAMFDPLPAAQCAMDPAMRGAFALLDESTSAALDPVLLEHRDLMYARHLELPLSL